MPSSLQPPPSALSLPEDVVLSVRHVSKKFCRNLKRSMWYGIGELARDFLLPSRCWPSRSSPVTHHASPALRADEFWALKNISFDLHQGESLGIIGMNGSGKSTLLRVLNSVFPPDTGEILTRGRVGGLIALGAGMHPHLTGRENIYLNGAILGMSKAEIDSKFDSIAKFSEIGDFLEAPLATYSSGMHVRLGFAVAIHGEPDILLVDEVLAVGDYSFVNKSLRYLSEYKKKAKAIIYISHNLEQVRNLCGRVIVLDKGKMIYQGPPAEAVSCYQDLCVKRRSGGGERQRGSGVAVAASEAIQVRDFRLMASGREVGMAEPLVLQCELNVNRPSTRPYFSVAIMDERGSQVIWKVSNDPGGKVFEPLAVGRYCVTMMIRCHHLMPGRYFPMFAIRDDDTMETFTRAAPEWSFAVRPLGGVIARGLVNVDAEWNIELSQG